MKADNVIYTDGHEVKVTDTDLQVKSHQYKLEGIYRFWMQILPAVRWPGILLASLGVITLLVGWLRLLPYGQYEVNTGDIALGTDPNTLAMWIGGILVAVGIVLMAVVKERYAVRISTAEGDKNAVVSTKKEYIAQILDALYAGIERFRPHTQPFPTHPENL